MTDSYKTLQSLILASEGKTLEDELKEFGCKVLVSNGAWLKRDRELVEEIVHMPYSEVKYLKEEEGNVKEDGFYHVIHEIYSAYGEPRGITWKRITI